ncbi:hypothetical protein POV27_09400 [Aureisphaera galaxeae]|uniref:hypothetical protein n=1 Tax=Aureisphaera galaxeae TaxID=1538023 RepID=UPI002350EE6A|nr:hypothetical protein [Aureisphaera galaxeae]MDC8004265.1 hypothetical protein [Aureisphaera galaxeae]
MWDNKEQQESWNTIEDIWHESAQDQEIKIAMSELMVELKKWTTSFEQNTIKRDVQLIKDAVSQFEKETIKKDIAKIERSVSEFEKDFMKKVITFIASIPKKILGLFKGKNSKQ